MPLKRCSKDGESGWQYGDGACYTGPDAKKKAVKQGLAEQYKDDKFTAAAIAEAYTRLHDDMSVELCRSYISQEERDKVSSEDFAGPHQSFPIRNQEDVNHAAHLIGHAADPMAVKRKIIAIARRKGLKIPDAWSNEP